MSLIRFRATLVVVVLALGAAVSHGQITGSSAADAIIRLNQPREDSVVGNSVDAGTGNFALSVQAVKIDGGRELGFTLLYDSIIPLSGLVARPRTLGPGWTHEYAARVVGTPASQIVEVNWDDNRRNRFRLEGGEYVPVEEAVRFDRLRQVDGLPGCSECFWEARRPDGALYQFAETGELLRLGNKIRQYIELEYESNRLVRLVEPISDRKLEFTYTNGNRGRILYVSDPAERRTYFSYDPQFGRLLTIHNPAEISGPYGPAFVPKPIPDNSPGGLVHTISVGTSEPVGVVALGAANIGHANVDELQVFVESPEGTRIEISGLANRPSASVLDFDGVALSDFHGENPNGTWILNVVDTAAGQTGEVNGWGFDLTSLSYPTHFSYNANTSILLQSFDAEGDRIFANMYDAFDRVAAQDDGLDSTPITTFSYAPTMRGGAITTYTDRLGQTQILEHDEDHRLRRYVNQLGEETAYSYDGAGNRTGIIDPLGRTTEFEHDADGNVVTIIDPESHTSRMDYDSNNNLLTFSDARGKVTTFAYTTNNNVRRITDAEGNEDEKTYNGNSQLIGNILHDGAGVDYSYNGGQATGAKRLDGRGSGEGADYSSIGLPTTLTDGEGNEIKLEYDTRGLVVKRTDQMDRVETMEYDARRRLIRKTDRNGGETGFAYDANGNRVSQTNALGQTTEFEYDEEDRLVRVVDPRGNASSRTYDAVGRVVERMDALGNTTRVEYDAVGNEIARYDAEGLKTAEAVYSDRDLLLSLEDAVGNVTTTDYNALKQPVSITDPAGRSSLFRFDSTLR